MEAENVYHVFDWLWCSAQLSESDIATLPAIGIEAVINLAPPTASNALPGEAELVANQGITYIQIPVAWEHPRLSQLEQFFAVLKAFKRHKVWVHCAKNKRASAFIYLYRRLCLAEEEGAASYPMSEIWTPNPVWQAFIDQAIQHIKGPSAHD
ncbi:protein tyrosine phosphatase family protein [Methylomonas sp. EbA]|uniref:Protein tyrosine phosphatase family protein n=1 Tax=Methylomonas albis TaxID=1854563 RepID=A0ABR9D1T9_9GAMM|nr:protein tyrosine phosphatase family protein [Methylomonas albis]